MTIEEEVREIINERYGSVGKLYRTTDIELTPQTIHKMLRCGFKSVTEASVWELARYIDLDAEALICGEIMPIWRDDG